ncbi:MAG TPA: hypothetical protein PLS90_10300 [Candidatus Sumerlaeota bacterium]|nr:hypothetical protein [Candidatus Sumerlaeota bacterium]HOR26885.1 hypothetical protein [Candidatus Sumerlaeota bacterium]HPK02833.1 hypothetical protein [Candidatus Sumerlaeota bacterium]
MGAIIALTAALGWSWPALLPIVGAVAAAKGYQLLSDPRSPAFQSRLRRELDARRIERVPLDSELAEIISDEIGKEERLIFEREDFVLVFRKDARGKFFIDAMGPRNKTRLDLRLRADEFAREIVRKFAYHRLAEQLLRVNAVIVEEQVDDAGRITMTARRWN